MITGHFLKILKTLLLIDLYNKKDKLKEGKLD